MRLRPTILAAIAVVAVVAGLGVWALARAVDDNPGPPPSAAEQRRQFCDSTAEAAKVATPAHLLAGNGQLANGLEEAAVLYKTATVFGTPYMPTGLRADYAKFVAELNRRQRPGARGRRDDAAVAAVDAAVRTCHRT